MRDNNIKLGGGLKPFLLALILSILLFQSALAQSSDVPTFPDDNAELVDPDLLNLTETQPQTETETETQTTPPTETISDSATGANTLSAVSIAGLASLGIILIISRNRKRISR